MRPAAIPPRLAAFIAVVFWGISFVATKIVLAEVSPATLIFTRFFIGVIVLLAMTRRLPPKSAWPALFVMGFIGVFVHQMLQSYALTMTSAVQTGWLIGVTPIWSAILSAIVLHEKLTRWKVVGLVGGFVGALLVVTRGDFSTAVFALPSTRGDLLILASTVNWAVYSILGHRTIRALGPRLATTGSMLAGLALLTPMFVIRYGWTEWPALTLRGWSAILFLGVCCSAIGYLFWYGALEHIEVSRVSVFLYLEPLITFAAAVMILTEPVSAVAVVGGLIVMVSVFVAQYAGGDSLKKQ